MTARALRAAPLPPVEIQTVGWVAAAAAAIAVDVAQPGFDVDLLQRAGGLAAAAALALLVTVFETWQVKLRHGDAYEGITLVDAVVPMSLLLLGGSWTVLVVAAGLQPAQLLLRRGMLKSAFNTGQITVAAAAAAATFELLRPAGAALDAPATLAAVCVAMVVYQVLNWAAVAGILARLNSRPFTELFHQGVALSALMTLGNTAVGVVGALLWTWSPWLCVLLLAPVYVLRVAYRDAGRARALAAEVATERDRLASVVGSASDGIAMVDPDGRLQVFSPTLEALTGVSQADAVGRPAAEVLGVDADALVRTGRHDVDIVHPSGRRRTVVVATTRTVDDRGRPAGAVLLVRDVTREREAERLKDDLIARVSHELRTPLTPIKGFAEVLLSTGRDGVSDELFTTALEMISSRADHMVGLIDDLLLVAQLSAQADRLVRNLKLRVHRVDRLVDAAVERFAAAFPDTPLEVAVGCAEAAVVVDGARFATALDAVLSNAVKFSPPHAPVRLAATAADRAVAVAVSDAGRGIPLDHLERVFERFHRVEPPETMTTGGAGMGLFIARALVEAMGGGLGVASTLGEGSTFTLTIPAADPIRGGDVGP